MTDMNPDDRFMKDTKVDQNKLQVDPMLKEGRRGKGSTFIIVGFLVIVVAITAVAIGSHRQEPGQAAIDAPPGAPGTPSVPVTTGSATPTGPVTPSGRTTGSAVPLSPNLQTQQPAPPPSNSSTQ